jgi:lipoprotein-anchoring transpeptidase ErfK/SrfK
MTRFSLLTLLCALFAAGACADRSVDQRDADPVVVATGWGGDDRLSRDQLAGGRGDPAWRQVVNLQEPLDTGAVNGIEEEQWDDISAYGVNQMPMRLPVGSGAAGPSALRVQVLLDRALFSPGIIDGRWGKNTEKAVYWFQEREGLRATGQVDRATFERLIDVARRPAELVVAHTLTEDDVAGPFVTIPSDIYDHAELECSCYESLAEQLGERFHVDPELLEQLNPGVDLHGLVAGDRLYVPLVRDANAAINERIARIIVSDRGHFVHALNGEGRIVLHFPSTLGSSYDPSPTGDWEVRSITFDPWWHYQPAILAHVDDDKPDARIPPGPNSAVGVVWMALSKQHYGIHGTSRPETIGYTTSAGCVRLTNWDAAFLARRIESGVKVEFRDT